jgi:putative heme iron utilization protein
MTDASKSGEASSERTMGLPPGYDGLAEAKRLLRAIRSGALATIDRNTGHPFASLVTVATDHDGTPLLLMSQLSAHTRNLDADARASILLSQGGKGDPLAHPRLTVIGRAVKQSDEQVRARLRSRFLARHPKAALYADFGDFAFWRLEIEGGHLNGGFAKAADYQGAVLKTDLAGADALIASEEDAVAHMNEAHAEALGLYATKLAGEPAGRWRATGLDPEGMDLMAGELTARLTFPQRITGPGDLRAVLVDLAQQARSVK